MLSSTIDEWSTLVSETEIWVLKANCPTIADNGFTLVADIKPNNILVDYEDSPEGNISVKSVKISDREDAVQLEPDQNLLGCLCGNQLWRSPESRLRVRQNTPSDIFSFAITAIYVMLDEMIFLVPDEELADGKEAWQAILMRRVSYFGDNDGFQGFLEHIEEENPMFESFIELALQVKPRK